MPILGETAPSGHTMVIHILMSLIALADQTIMDLRHRWLHNHNQCTKITGRNTALYTYDMADTADLHGSKLYILRM